MSQLPQQLVTILLKFNHLKPRNLHSKGHKRRHFWSVDLKLHKVRVVTVSTFMEYRGKFASLAFNCLPLSDML